jgi:predicted permease
MNLHRPNNLGTMRRLRSWISRLAGVFHKERRDLDFAEELDSHLQLHIEDSVRAGLPPEEARRQAIITLGGVEQTKESYRDRRGIPTLESVIQDVRFGLRVLSKNPGFTAVAALTLAVAIGANSALFSVVDAVLLKPLPYPDPHSLVEIWNTYPTLPQAGLSGADFQNWREQVHEFADMGGYRFVSQGFNVGDHGEPHRLQATFVTSNLFSILGVSPLLGRAFSNNEDKPGSTPVVMLSHRAWQNVIGGDSHAVGRLITLDGRGYTVIGILPAEFTLANWADLWLPAGQMDIDELMGRVHHPFAVIARLRPGASIPQAQAELSTFAHQAEVSFPATNKNFGVTVHRLEDSSAAKMRQALVELFAAVGLVLLIACANVVNLLLARNKVRQQEIGLRIAVGASRMRIARQLLTENLLLFMLGAALGLVLATVVLSAVRNSIPADFANAKEARLNGGVLLFTFVVCAVTGILCGLSPVLQSVKTDLNAVLKESGQGSSAFNTKRVQSFLVISEVALALMLVIGAGLVIRSFRYLIEINPGFRSDHLLTMQVPETATPSNELRRMSPDQLKQFSAERSLQFEELAERIQTLAGVEHVGGIDVLPLASSMSQSTRFVIEGQPIPPASARPFAEIRTVSVGYFAAIGIPLVKGRLFTPQDWALPRIVINEGMSKRFWPNSNAIGQRINLCSLAPQPCWSTIIGVIGNVHQFGLNAGPTFDVYITGGWTPYLVIRTASEPLSAAAASVNEIHDTEPSLPVIQIETADRLLSDSLSPRRFAMILVACFAALALSMAVVGVYGVMNYMVVQKTHDIGIRMALGAQRRDVLRLVLKEGAKLALIGAVFGLVAALALARLLGGVLYGVSATDPATFTGVSILLIAAALLACYIPARRAMQVDPVVALRHE